MWGEVHQCSKAVFSAVKCISRLLVAFIDDSDAPNEVKRVKAHERFCKKHQWGMLQKCGSGHVSLDPLQRSLLLKSTEGLYT